MKTLPSLEPFIQTFLAISANYSFGNIPAENEGFNTLWNLILEHHHELQNEGFVLGEQSNHFAFDLLSLSAILFTRARGGITSVQNQDHFKPWVSKINTILKTHLEKSALFSNSINSSLSDKYKNSETALVHLLDSTLLNSLESFMDINAFHQALNNEGSTLWARSGDPELLEFAKKTGYIFKHQDIFHVVNPDILNWFFKNGVDPLIKNNNGKTLRDFWTTGYTQKDMDALSRVLVKYEKLDPEEDKNNFLKSLWTMSRGTLKRESKRLNLNFQNGKYGTLLWNNLIHLPHGNHLSQAAIDLVDGFDMSSNSYNEQGFHFGALLFLKSLSLNATKASNLIEQKNKWVTEFKDFPDLKKLEELGKITASKSFKLNSYTDNHFITLNQIAKTTPHFNHEQNKQFIQTLCFLSDHYYLSNIFSLHQQKQSTHFSTFRNETPTFDVNQSLIYQKIKNTPDDIIKEFKEDLSYFLFSYILKTLNSFYVKAGEEDKLTQIMKGLLFDIGDEPSLYRHLSQLGATHQSEIALKVKEKLNTVSPVFLAMMEKENLTNALPENINTILNPLKKRI